MVRTVAREFNWLPTYIGSLFIDAQDYEGLEFWYNDVLQVNAEIEAKAKSKTEIQK